MAHDDDTSTRILLSHEVEAGLRRAILSGRFRPGEVLRDRDLLALYGVSRTPVREALHALEHAGLVEVLPNRAVRVVDPAPDGALCALQTLGVLMRGIVRTAGQMLAGPRATSLTMIDETLARLEHQDRRAIDRVAAGYYRGWAELTPNPVLRGRAHQVMDGLSYRVRLASGRSEVPWEHLIQANTALRRAVDDGLPDAAVSAIERMHFLDDDRPADDRARTGP
ncbi:GntR family transcriptional regulator [Curtobacterium sp. MCBA15_001]|uniref:GntR family transcriptional regulator n=1 Tax=Curtobacterium sp. MCBA15_001 TaxID=1898731 RepID=UPI0008DD10A4|nr:GntR family transcriptional regulator [Curtobacterium sp. MCBA15_001]OIH94348.1 hypothetical protein BIU90_04130 [Curtobacterium sp. MCBA15_001]